MLQNVAPSLSSSSFSRLMSVSRAVRYWHYIRLLVFRVPRLILTHLCPVLFLDTKIPWCKKHFTFCKWRLPPIDNSGKILTASSLFKWRRPSKFVPAECKNYTQMKQINNNNKKRPDNETMGITGLTSVSHVVVVTLISVTHFFSTL